VDSFEGQLKNFVFSHIVDKIVWLYAVDKRPQSSDEKVLKHIELVLNLVRKPGIKVMEISPFNLGESRHKSQTQTSQAIAKNGINKR
jgi:hypothetical protein